MPNPDLVAAVVPKTPVEEPDAHGQAALLLAESILHALVESATLSNPEAIEIVKMAAEVKLDVATEAGESVGRMNESLELLSRITASFTADEPTPRGPTLHALG